MYNSKGRERRGLRRVVSEGGVILFGSKPHSIDLQVEILLTFLFCYESEHDQIAGGFSPQSRLL